MIIDKIENITLYKNIPSEIVDFLQNKLNSELKLGRYNLSGDNYVNVETYTTKPISQGRFEAHKKYIDIQILLKGTERIYYTSTTGLITIDGYDETKDIEFFSNPISSSDYLTLDGSNFALIYPHEAHAPQIESGKNMEVIKVVVKVKI
jgi:YhcH/YjgK/YiaL family protein